MSQKTPFATKVDKHKNLSWYKTKNPLVSKTLNIYANALNSCLCISPAGPFPSVNLPSRVLNLEGFSWHKGYRNPLASISYTKTYQKFLEALHLITLVRQKGGGIYVIFDGDELRPPSSFLDPQKKNTSKKKQVQVENSFFDPKGPVRPQSTNLNSQTQKQGAALHHGSRVFDLHNKASLRPKTQNPSSKLLQNKRQYENISWSGEKWVGGTFSNFKQVSKSINLYKTLSRQFLETLECQTSPRYFVMAKKFHGNLFSSKKISSAFLLQEGAFWKEASTKEGTKWGSSFGSLARYGQDLAQRAMDFACIASPRSKRDMTLKEILVVGEERKPITFSACTDKQSMQGKAKQSGGKKCLKYKNLPDLIIIENAEKYRNVIAEAETLKIPVIAFVESDILSNISIALPINALKHYFLAFLLYIIY